MGKGAIAKKRGPPSVRSRAARRATSPGIDTDKSLKDARAPADDSVDHRPAILAIHHGAGVTKKSKRARNLSSKARKRQEKDQDRALAIMERTDEKVSKSKARGRVVQYRRKDWADINKDAPEAANKFAGLVGDEDEGEETSDLDDDMGEDAQQAGGNKQEQPQSLQVDAASVPLPSEGDMDDGIL